MSRDRRVAIVTGGSRGIGLGIARRLADAGLDLAIAGRRSATDVAEALDELRARGADVCYVAGDLADAEARDALVAGTLVRFGTIHVLVNNAGVGSRERGVDLLDTTAAAFEWLLRANLVAPHFLTQLVARHLVAGRRADPAFRACVVNVTSVSAEVVSPARADYCVAKAGLSMATKVWAARLAADGIPVYEVRPGVIATDMTAGVRERYDDYIAAGNLLEPRWGTPDDVGRAVAMLVRGELSYATGQVVTVDGGLTMKRL
ncbi:MAG: 3-ketoacyl-ACP reductase [Planctomycetes bacterium]|nr:3-ketoacyl-ACP reductase [Planctomycetota bacterium]